MINSRRREERVPAKLPVRVWGMDAHGKPFTHPTSTIDLTRTGARIGAIPCELQQGDIIGIQHGNEKARFRVAWVGRPGTARQGQIGVVCTEQGKYIWGAPLETFKAAARAEMARSTLGRPSPSFVGPVAPMQQTSVPPRDAERRDAIRFACTGGAEFRNIAGGFKNWGTVSDVSDTGCYVETIFPLPSDTRVELLISVRNIDIRCQARVRSSDPNVGMGIEFVEMSPEDQQRLKTLLSMLAVVPGFANHPTVPVNRPSIAPRTSNLPLGPRVSPDLSLRIDRVCNELRQLETIFHGDIPAALQSETETFNKLITAVASLHKRLAALANDHRAEDPAIPAS